MVYTVTLNPAIDYYMKINEMKDDVQNAEQVSLNYGGKGINVSVILTHLGIENTALGFVGGHTGEMLKSLLSKEKIHTDFVSIDGSTRINVKIVGAKDIIVNAKGPSITLKNEQELIQKLSKIKDGDYLVLSGSVPSSMGSSAYARIMEAVGDKNIKLIADTTGSALESLLAYRPFFIKPNNFELEDFFNTKLNTKDDIVKCARQLQNMGAKNVLVSCGRDGMLLVDENGEVNSEPILDGEVKNTTGCGDSAVAGFLAGYIKKSNYRYALRVANACANATAFSTKLASKGEILNMLNIME